MASDGSRVRLFLRNASNAAVSKDGRQIAFVRARAIWVMQRDGSGQRQLTHPPRHKRGDPSADDDPAWSPDGRIVYFSRIAATTNGPASLFSVRGDGSGLRRLTRAPNDTGWNGEGTCHEDPAPSPDGRLVVYISVGSCMHGFDRSLATITSAGRPAKLPVALPDFTEPYYTGLAWMPGGDRLAYAVFDLVGVDQYGTALYVSDTDGSRPRRIVAWRATWESGWSGRIAWSSDGNWLVLDKGGIWLVRRDGTGLRRMTPTRTDNVQPAWLPPAR